MTLFRYAAEVLASGRCVWCVRAPALPGSHLCATCRRDDPDGVLDAPVPVAARRRA
ncbi:MAG TPA: hypothetical protein VE777_13065 [Gaiellales bacterium]|nr:hypothetical protein [Gaiellales bacterium]